MTKYAGLLPFAQQLHSLEVALADAEGLDLDHCARVLQADTDADLVCRASAEQALVLVRGGVDACICADAQPSLVVEALLRKALLRVEATPTEGALEALVDLAPRVMRAALLPLREAAVTLAELVLATLASLVSSCANRRKLFQRFCDSCLGPAVELLETEHVGASGSIRVRVAEVVRRSLFCGDFLDDIAALALTTAASTHGNHKASFHSKLFAALEACLRQPAPAVSGVCAVLSVFATASSALNAGDSSSRLTGAASWRSHILRLLRASVGIGELLGPAEPTTMRLRALLLQTLVTALRSAGKALPDGDKAIDGLRTRLSEWANAAVSQPGSDALMVLDALLGVDHKLVCGRLKELVPLLLQPQASAAVRVNLLLHLVALHAQLRLLPELLACLVELAESTATATLLQDERCQTRLVEALAQIPSGQIGCVWRTVSSGAVGDAHRGVQGALAVPLAKAALAHAAFALDESVYASLCGLMSSALAALSSVDGLEQQAYPSLCACVCATAALLIKRFPGGLASAPQAKTGLLPLAKSLMRLVIETEAGVRVPTVQLETVATLLALVLNIDPGGVLSEPSSVEQLLHCFMTALRAQPADISFDTLQTVLGSFEAWSPLVVRQAVRSELVAVISRCVGALCSSEALPASFSLTAFSSALEDELVFDAVSGALEAAVSEATMHEHTLIALKMSRDLACVRRIGPGLLRESLAALGRAVLLPGTALRWTLLQAACELLSECCHLLPEVGALDPQISRDIVRAAVVVSESSPQRAVSFFTALMPLLAGQENALGPFVRDFVLPLVATMRDAATSSVLPTVKLVFSSAINAAATLIRQASPVVVDTALSELDSCCTDPSLKPGAEDAPLLDVLRFARGEYLRLLCRAADSASLQEACSRVLREELTPLLSACCCLSGRLYLLTVALRGLRSIGVTPSLHVATRLVSILQCTIHSSTESVEGDDCLVAFSREVLFNSPLSLQRTVLEHLLAETVACAREGRATRSLSLALVPHLLDLAAACEELAAESLDLLVTTLEAAGRSPPMGTTIASVTAHARRGLERFHGSLKRKRNHSFFSGAAGLWMNVCVRVAAVAAMQSQSPDDWAAVLELLVEVLSKKGMASLTTSSTGTLSHVMRTLVKRCVASETSDGTAVVIEDCYKSCARIFALIASSAELKRHARLYVAIVIDTLSEFPVSKSIRELLMPGVFGLIDCCHKREKATITSVLEPKASVYLSDVMAMYEEDFRFSGE